MKDFFSRITKSNRWHPHYEWWSISILLIFP